LNLVECLRGMCEVFDVYSDSAGLQNHLDCHEHLFCGLSKASDNISRKWNAQDPGDSSNSRDKLVSTDHLTVRIAQRDQQARAGRRDCREPCILKHARTRNIPSVRKNQNPLPVVKRTKILRLLLLR